jgi:hypothetical protein
MSNVEVLIAELIAVGIPCVTIVIVAWLFFRRNK